MALSLVVIFMENAMYMCTSMQMVLSLVVCSMQKNKYAMTLSLAVDSMQKAQYPKSLVRKLL